MCMRACVDAKRGERGGGRATPEGDRGLGARVDLIGLTWLVFRNWETGRQVELCVSAGSVRDAHKHTAVDVIDGALALYEAIEQLTVGCRWRASDREGKARNHAMSTSLREAGDWRCDELITVHDAMAAFYSYIEQTA